MATGQTDEQGRFEVFDTRDKMESFTLRLSGHGYQPQVTGETYSWGDRDITLVVQPTRFVDIEVVEAGTGRPVEEFAIATRAVEEDRSSSVIGQARLGGRHPDGVLRIDGLVSGDSQLLVIPRDESLSVHGPMLISPETARGERLRVELQRLAAVSVRVSLPDGQRVEGSTVTVAERLPDTRLSRLVDRRAQALSRTESQWDIPVYAAAATGPDGVAELWVPPGLEEVHLVVTGDHPDVAVTKIIPGSGGELIEVEVEMRVLVSGRVEFPEGDRATMGLYFERTDTSVFTAGVPREGIVEVGEDGRFARRMDRGSYEAHLIRKPPRNSAGPRVTVGSGWEAQEPPLAQFEAVAEPVELELDATSHLLGAVEGVLRVHGQPQAGATVRIGGEYGPWRGVRTDSEGKFLFPDLQPGDYQLRHRGPDDAPWPVELISNQSWTVTGGNTTAIDVDFRPREVRLRVLDAASGKPYAGVDTVVLDAGGGRVETRTDDDGWLTLTHASGGRVGVHFEVGGVKMMAHPVEIPEDPDVKELEVHARPRDEKPG